MVLTVVGKAVFNLLNTKTLLVYLKVYPEVKVTKTSELQLERHHSYVNLQPCFPLEIQSSYK